MLGRTDEAAASRRCSATHHGRGDRRAGARAAVHGVHRDRDADESELDALEARVPPDTELGLELLVARAIGEARIRLAQRRDDWRDPLLAVRPRLGWDATMTIVRDLWWKIAILMFALGIAGRHGAVCCVG